MPGRYSTRLHLFALVAAVVIPLIAFAALAIYRYAKTEQARVEQDTVRIASQAGLLAEADLKQMIAKLEGLIASSALARDDNEQFHAEAKLLTEGRDETIILRDMGVRQLFNSQLPFGAPLPASPPFSPEELASYASGRAYISDVYLSPRNKEPRIVIALPIMRNGSPRYVIGTTIPTSRILNALLPAVQSGYVVAVGDRKGAYVTRSERHDEFTGKPGLPEYVNQVVGKSGTFRSPNFAGNQLVAGYYRSDLSGWFYTANIPAETIEAPLKTSLLQLAAFGGAALVISGLLALMFSQGITAAAGGLANRAHALGEGLEVRPLTSRLAEFALISDALVTASDSISARARERARATEREALLASIFDAVGIYVGILEKNGAGFRFVAANRAASSAFGGNEQSILNSHSMALVPLCAKALSEGAPFTAEFSAGLPDEDRTFIGTFTAVSSSAAEPIRVAFTAMDITERKRSEIHRQLLVNELNHRVKNSLTIAQSIATQTLRSARSMQEAQSALSARLVSLAHTHDILTRENWEGANVEDIVAHAVEPYGAPGRISTDGPSLRLAPGPALTLSLLLHELMTNSAKYGALSADAGTIAIRWRRSAEAGQPPRLSIKFEEANGPVVIAPTHKGFGSRLFSASFASPAEGRISVSYPPSGVICDIEMRT